MCDDKNLCDTCIYCFADCLADYCDIKFGNGYGGDNVIECPDYEEDKSV